MAQNFCPPTSLVNCGNLFLVIRFHKSPIAAALSNFRPSQILNTSIVYMLACRCPQEKAVTYYNHISQQARPAHVSWTSVQGLPYGWSWIPRLSMIDPFMWSLAHTGNQGCYRCSQLDFIQSRQNRQVAFPNARGKTLSRDGVNYLLQECVERAVAKCPSLANKRISPHFFRHSTAMHMLQSGVDITVIALWLGHESIQTAHGYIEADLATKEEALEKVAPAGQVAKRFKADDELLRFLATL